MPHVTFIHGILNKPPKDVLLNIWNQALAADDGVDLGANGVTSSMVYWADILYESPDQSAAHESADGLPDGGATEVEFAWMTDASTSQRKLMNRLAARLEAAMPPPPPEAADVPQETTVTVAEAAATAAGPLLERIPLPWAIKRKVMESLLRDVHHYLFNSTSTPRPGAKFKVQDVIRERFVEALKADRPADGPHVVVSHSMGTVIAYDCLKRVSDCPTVDALFTLGSPLGIDEVRDLLHPDWTPDRPIPGKWQAAGAFPEAKLNGPWHNLFDRLDPVDGTAPHISGYYKRKGQVVVEDTSVTNRGWWRHDLNQYFARTELRTRLAKVLGL